MRHSICSMLKITLKRFFWTVLLTLLAACGTVAPPATPTRRIEPVETLAPVISKTSMPTFTPIPPTEMPSPVPTILPTSTPLPPFPMNGYVMVFNKDGDLYFQDGNNSPVKITHVGEKAPPPILSNDNKKIVFSRANDSTRYSINTDGSQEQAIITNDWLTTLRLGTVAGNLTFIPNTHQARFNTYLCESQEPNSPCSIGLFLVNTDTGKITKVLPPGKLGQYDNSENFMVSPNGKMVSVGTVGHIDILDINGKVIRHNILPYTPSMPSKDSFSLFPVQFWLPDSNGLILAFPDTIKHTDAYGDVPAYTIWRYTIDSNTAVQIPLDPSPLVGSGSYDKIQVSLDGNWILYGGSNCVSSIYLGNLGNGKARLLDDEVGCPYFSWSPDSKYFIYGSFLGDIGELRILITRINSSTFKWVDVSYFIYLFLEEKTPKTRIGKIDGEIIKNYDPGFESIDVYILRPK